MRLGSVGSRIRGEVPVPVSKKRKRKAGTVAKFKRDRYEQRRRQIEMDIDAGEHMTTGVSLQDLINMVAYQDYREQGLVEGPEIPDSEDEVDFENPTSETIIRAVHESNKIEENEDGR